MTMKIASHSDQCLSFIHSQLDPRTKHPLPAAKHRPAVTISRECGCGAMAIATELAAFLQARAPAQCHWTVFDKNLVEKVLDEHKLPKEVAKFMQEDHVSAIQDAVEEILGLHPPTLTLWQHTAATVRDLAELGQVILIGRGATVITRGMSNVFNVRLIAPLETRVQHIMARNQLDQPAALKWVRQTDRNRQRYLKAHFHTDIADPLQYDLVINTGRIPPPVVAHLIGEAVVQWAATL